VVLVPESELFLITEHEIFWKKTKQNQNKNKQKTKPHTNIKKDHLQQCFFARDAMKSKHEEGKKKKPQAKQNKTLQHCSSRTYHNAGSIKNLTMSS